MSILDWGHGIPDDAQAALAIALLVIGIYLWRRLNAAIRGMHDREVFRTFGLDPREYRLDSSDVGGRRGRVLRGCGMVGAPDALFRHRSDRRVIVGEYKGRRHAGRVRARERYQITGYMGLAERHFKTPHVEGRLAYRDEVVVVPFDAELFEKLAALVPEYRSVRRRWKIVNRVPLANR